MENLRSIWGRAEPSFAGKATDFGVLVLGQDTAEQIATRFERRRAAAQAMPGTYFRLCRLYFCDLDHRTDRDLLAASADDPDASELMRASLFLASLLGRRIVARARLFCPEHGACLPRELRSAPIEFVRRVSRVQLECARRAFGDLTDPLKLDLIERAYEHFAAGQLRHVVDGRAVCEPDSAYFFMFAEFALLAIQLDVDAQEWRGLLCGLVRAQLLYAFVYGPTGSSPRPFGKFHQLPAEERSVPDRYLTLLRLHFASLGPRELEYEASRHCAMFFRGDVELNLPEPDLLA
jgi:hypothetical protein